MKDNFVLYTRYADAILGMTDEQAGMLLKAIYRFVTTGEQEEIADSTARFAYRIIVSQIEQSNKQYEEKCARNRENIRKRWNTKNNECITENTNKDNGIRTNTNEYQKIRTYKVEYL